jgi:hypothetical protein
MFGNTPVMTLHQGLGMATPRGGRKHPFFFSFLNNESDSWFQHCQKLPYWGIWIAFLIENNDLSTQGLWEFTTTWHWSTNKVCIVGVEVKSGRWWCDRSDQRRSANTFFHRLINQIGSQSINIYLSVNTIKTKTNSLESVWKELLRWGVSPFPTLHSFY